MSQDLPSQASRAPRMKKLPPDFEAFHQMYRPLYVNWAKSRLGNWHDAEEAVDAAFEQLLKAWSTVLSKENPTAYAWRVIRNSTIDHSRTRDRRPALIGEAFETVALTQAVDPISQLEESLNLYAEIEQLPPRQMDVAFLHFGLGYSAVEIAAALGITPAGVRSTVRHAKRRLQHAYGVKQNLTQPRTDDEGHAEEGKADDIAH
ncbi:sigma-70 family RNA polymerase sigma factor [Streptomyces sp. T12]|uniref:RNA polymerase sigma factor n=1 Tax=unclassified Streptomyces TaxID=2593676 RepID=UPI0027D3453E|nr:sigma-70 family RNA polymerase sigma factor [Streptomyces sp. T12]